MSQQIGVNFDVRIPTLGDDASIEEALKVYHYGIDDYSGQQIQLVPPLGIEAHFQVLTNDVTAINAELDNLPNLYIESISTSASENIIYSNAIGTTPLKIKAITNQTAPLLTFQNAAGASVSEITTAGAFSGRALLAADSTASTQAVNTNNTSLATTAFVLGQVSSTSPLMNNAVATGTSLKYSREDHVHPVDTSRSPLAGSASLVTLGTVTTGTWHGTLIAGQYGGTGVANTGKTITLGGNLTTSGAYPLTLTLVGSTNVSLPTSGTLAVQGVGTSLSQFGTGSTSSSQLSALLSDNTGSGNAVFSTSPTLSTSLITNSSSFDLLNTTVATINFGAAATSVNVGNVTGDVTIMGNLIVQGSTTTSSSENLEVGANTIAVGIDTSDNNKDRGMLFKWNTGGIPKVGFFGFDDSTGKWTFIPQATVTLDVMSGTKGTLDANVEWADILTKPSPVITLGGDLSGSVTLTSLGSGTLTATIVANAVALGADTTGNYTATVAGTTNQVNVSGAVGEGQAAVLSLPQDIHTGANPTFAGATLDAVRVGITATNEIDTTAGNLILDSFTGTTQVDDNLTVSGTAVITGDTTITGNLTVNGTTVTVNSTTVSVDDKNIELGSIASPSDATADGGGITLKGTSDKTFNWVDATDAWTSSEHMNLLTGKAYEINGTSVLSATTLGSGVTASSLTSVGTVTTGTWSASTIAVNKGGTGITTTPANGALLIGNGSGYVSTTISQGTGISVTNGAGTITIGLSAASLTIGTTAISLGGTTTTLDGMTGFTFSDALGTKTTYYTGYYNGIENNTMYYKSGGTTFRWYLSTPDNGTSDIMELTASLLTVPALSSNGAVSASGAVSGSSLSTAGTVSAAGLAGSLLSSATPQPNGTAGPGTSAIPSRQDHIHAADTTRAPLNSPTFTGVPAAPTAAVDTNTTQLATTAFVINQAYAKLAGPTFTGTVTLPSTTSIGTVSNIEIGYLDGVTSGIQAQLDSKQTGVISINAQAASYTLALTDLGKMVELSNASANTLTVPPFASVAFAVGTTIVITQTGAGQTTLTPGAGVTINGTPGLKLRTQWSTATLVKRSTNVWLAFGDLIA